MKGPLQEAADLFRLNQQLSQGAAEQENFYRGLALLADGLSRLEKRLEENESEARTIPRRIFNGQRRFRPRVILAPAQT